VILTGSAIAAAQATDEITIEPYDPARLSPNAYDWCLACRSRSPVACGRAPFT
jgi:dCTP deaminase